jgi:hypothetical protein
VERLVKTGVNVNAVYGDHDNNAIFKDPWTSGWPMASNRWTPLIALAGSNRYPDPPRPISGSPEDREWSIAERKRIPAEKLKERTSERTKIARILVEANAALDLHDGYGATALYSAVYSRYDELALLLIEHGANVNTKTGVYIDGNGDNTPLHRATGSPELVEALIQAGADVNAPNDAGDTPLHWAVRLEDLASVVLLLDAGANPESTNKSGEKPIVWASDSDYASENERAIYRTLSNRETQKHNKSRLDNPLPRPKSVIESP